METLAIVISVVTLLAVAFLIIKLNQPAAPQSDQAIELIQKQMTELRGTITKGYADNNQSISNINSTVTDRLDKAANAMKDVYGRLGEVQESTKQVNEVAKDIASLQDILRAPKIRGGMGELFLSDLLKQVLPPARYKLQHRFASREAVDAVILLKEAMVPVDSKFPLENFKKISSAKSESEKLTAKKQFIRDVKKHIDAIKQKYILPDEGTFDFALMYIPAENVYYEVIIKDENLDDEKGLFKYAIDNKVIPVSPNSFYGYLQTILMGLRGMQIEERAQEILQDLSRLEGDFTKVMDDFHKMGTHLKNLSGSYDATDKRLGKFSDKLESLETKSEPLPLSQ
ncbi:DNA recombination protein RmuC [Candidatus Margulisiibacteriota bacterium]